METKEVTVIEKQFYELENKPEEIKSFIKNNLSMIIKPETELIKNTSNKLLDIPIKDAGDIKDEIPKQLLDLQSKINELSPSNYNKGIFNKILSLFDKNRTVNNFINKFKTGEEFINNIIEKLEEGKKILQQDTISLENEKNMLENAQKSLNTKINYLQKLLEILKQEQKDEELIFELSTKLQDLTQLLAVSRNGIESIKLILQTNKELSNGVDRTINITTTALKNAVVIYVAINNQKQVLEAKKAVDETTSNLIYENSKMLKEQGSEILKQTYEPTLDMNKLEESIKNVNSTIEEIKDFKIKALPKIEENINKMKNLLQLQSKS